jgi:hypothetical protein
VGGDDRIHVYDALYPGQCIDTAVDAVNHASQRITDLAE